MGYGTADCILWQVGFRGFENEGELGEGGNRGYLYNCKIFWAVPPPPPPPGFF